MVALDLTVVRKFVFEDNILKGVREVLTREQAALQRWLRYSP